MNLNPAFVFQLLFRFKVLHSLSRESLVSCHVSSKRKMLRLPLTSISLSTSPPFFASPSKVHGHGELATVRWLGHRSAASSDFRPSPSQAFTHPPSGDQGWNPRRGDNQQEEFVALAVPFLLLVLLVCRRFFSVAGTLHWPGPGVHPPETVLLDSGFLDSFPSSPYSAPISPFDLVQSEFLTGDRWRRRGRRLCSRKGRGVTASVL